MAAPIRILLVDDHQVVLEGLEAMLASQHERVEIVASTTDAEEALRLAAEHAPDIVLLDVRLKRASGLDLCRDLIARDPNTKVVFFTVYDDEQYLFEALRLGAAGYLLKQTTAPELVDHLARVREGEVAIDSSIAGRVALSAARLQRGEYWPGAHIGLTQRESEVLSLMVRGLTNKAIALELCIGEETVKSHSSAVYRKLEVPDRAQAVVVALREGIFR
ncbi:MAG: response regulator [Acidimicrobiia bacterium]